MPGRFRQKGRSHLFVYARCLPPAAGLSPARRVGRNTHTTMNEQQLKQIITDYADDCKWLGTQNLWAWIRPEGLRPLVEAAGSFFDDGPVSADLSGDGTVVVDITDICAYWEIDPERIIKKK
jgi:hypothetical protein